MHPTLAPVLTPHVLADRERSTRTLRFHGPAAARVRARHVDEHGGFRGTLRLAGRALRGRLAVVADGCLQHESPVADAR